MKTYRFAQISKDGNKWRVDTYEVMRPLSGQVLELGDVERFLATAQVDEVMLDEREDT